MTISGAGSLTLIIGRLPNRPLDRDLVSEKLFDEPISIVAARSSLWARRRKITLAELIGEPWILPQRGTEVGSIIGDIFVANGLPEPTAPVICSSIEMYWGLLATGKFVAAMPMSLLKFATQRNTIKELPIQIKTNVDPRRHRYASQQDAERRCTHFRRARARNDSTASLTGIVAPSSSDVSALQCLPAVSCGPGALRSCSAEARTACSVKNRGALRRGLAPGARGA